MIIDYLKDAEKRFERKFMSPDLCEAELIQIIKHHPLMFSEIFHSRYVNSLYLDTFDLKNYWDNICGAKDRLKVRVRWYDKLFGTIDKPKLELKIKDGWASWKALYPLDKLRIVKGFNSDEISGLLNHEYLSDSLTLMAKSLEPLLLVRYKRIYFLSADKRFRITIDSGIEYYRVSKYKNNFLGKTDDFNTIILELKYSEDNDNRADEVSKHFPFRLTKSSKYVTGIRLLTIAR